MGGYIREEDVAAKLAHSQSPATCLQNFHIFKENANKTMVYASLERINSDHAMYAAGELVYPTTNEKGLSAVGLVTDKSLSLKYCSFFTYIIDNLNLVKLQLSQLQEWCIEHGPGGGALWVKTAYWWYKLGTPSPEYAPTYAPLHKKITMVVVIAAQLLENSKLSFNEVITKVCITTIFHDNNKVLCHTDR